MRILMQDVAKAISDELVGARVSVQSKRDGTYAHECPDCKPLDCIVAIAPT